MRKYLFRILIFVFVGPLLLFTFKSYAYDDDDGAFQVWLTTSQDVKAFQERLKISLEEEFRWGDEGNKFYYYHLDFGLAYVLNKYWDIGGGYREVYELSNKGKYNGKFQEENQPYMLATLKLKQGKFSFTSRNRFEYRHFDYKPDSWRYRNKFTLKYPLQLGKINIEPYIADEIYFSCFSGTNQFNQNRFSSGIGVDITKNIKGEVYYMLVTVKRSTGWYDSNVLGTKIKIVF